MIFVTVGTEQPFDRMLRWIDRWAATNPSHEIFAQIGKHAWEPKNIPFRDFLSCDEYQRIFRSASCVVSHAGMGTLLSALCSGKPIIVMPKRAKYGEHRSDHQLATASRMHSVQGVHVAYTHRDLIGHLSHASTLSSPNEIGPYAAEPMLNAVRKMIYG